MGQRHNETGNKFILIVQEDLRKDSQCLFVQYLSVTQIQFKGKRRHYYDVTYVLVYVIKCKDSFKEINTQGCETTDTEFGLFFFLGEGAGIFRNL